MIARALCSRCGRCPAPNGECEEKISRGRRFFLLGALALPVAAKVERVAALVAPEPFIGPALVPDLIRIQAAMPAFNPTVVQAIQDGIMRAVFRDAPLPRMLFRQEDIPGLTRLALHSAA